jgi:hypothetical protein
MTEIKAHLLIVQLDRITFFTETGFLAFGWLFDLHFLG